MASKKKYIDSTIAFTTSSFAYMDPYQPKGSIAHKMKNKVRTFITMRSLENEFVDFKSYQIHDQFREIYQDLFEAFRRGDKVVLNRSLSQNMYDYNAGLLKSPVKIANPYYKIVNGLTLMQARTYANSDLLLPED